MALPVIVAAVGKAALRQAAVATASKAAGGGGDDGAPWGKIIAAAVVILLVASGAVMGAFVGVISLVTPGSVSQDTCILFPGDSNEIPADLEDTNNDGIGDASANAATASFSSGAVDTSTVAPSDGTVVIPLPANTYLLELGYGARSSGEGAFHYGVDFSAPEGTPVLAVADGRVIKIVTGDAAYGNVAYIAHNIDGAIVTTAYKYLLSVPEVSVDQIVKSGQEIGKVGATGKSSGNHLHLEVWNSATDFAGDASVDPQIWLTDHNAVTLGAGLPAIGGSSGPVNLDATGAEVCVLNETGYGSGHKAGSSGGLTNGAWGGFSNGEIPMSALRAISWDPGEHARPDAEQALESMNVAYKARFGVNMSITDSYRTYARQVECLRFQGSLCAKPGYSNHGWGLAIDFGGGINRFGTVQRQWMESNAGSYGWVSPDWAQAGTNKPEAWHWEYVG